MRYSEKSKRFSTAHNTASLSSRQSTKEIIQRDSSEPYKCFITQHIQPRVKTHLFSSSVSPPAVCTTETGPSGALASFSNTSMETFPSYLAPESMSHFGFLLSLLLYIYFVSERIEKDSKTIKRRCIEQFMSPFAFAKYVADQLPAGCYELPKLQHSLSKGVNALVLCISFSHSS
jgi:hypothetical protein